MNVPFDQEAAEAAEDWSTAIAFGRRVRRVFQQGLPPGLTFMPGENFSGLDQSQVVRDSRRCASTQLGAMVHQDSGQKSGR
ncbi:hypothetical protein AB0M02_29930 [Actinoplanes sp. NPDC051861]|uniref:hypothetical protein n=1 Tax=Actinoplanes sp. NPDC051861 TaxID=3155170 RepID=UPI003422BA12